MLNQHLRVLASLVLCCPLRFCYDMVVICCRSLRLLIAPLRSCERSCKPGKPGAQHMCRTQACCCLQAATCALTCCSDMGRQHNVAGRVEVIVIGGIGKLHGGACARAARRLLFKI